MANWVNSIQMEDLLVVWNTSDYSKSEQREITHLLSNLPIGKIILLGRIEEILPIFLERGRTPISWKQIYQRTRSSGEVILLEINETSLLSDPVIQETIHRWMCVSAKIIIGIAGTESWLLRLYQNASLSLGVHLPPGLLLSKQPIPEGYSNFFRERSTQVIEYDPIDWLQNEVAGYHQGNSRLSDSSEYLLLKQDPYLFLDSYDQAASPLFYGRMNEIRVLAELSISSQLTVLYGQSGIGKTSLVGAGLLPLLAKNNICGIHVRISPEPSWGLASAQINQPLSQNNLWQPNSDFIELLTNLSETSNQLIVVVFDQFEEIFTLASKLVIDQFTASIHDAVTKITKPIHFVFSVREDYLAYLADLRSYLPRILDRTFKLEPLNVRQAYDVIVSPAKKCGYQFDAGLADLILAHLVEGKQAIDPVDLQIICFRLFKRAKEKETQEISIQDYLELGETEMILARYLEDVVSQDDCPVGTIDVLKGLTTSLGTKVLLSIENLAEDIARDVNEVKKILEWLERPYRLIRTVQNSQNQLNVELRHDVLAKRIFGWVTDLREQNAKQVKDLLRKEIQSNNRMGLIPSRAKFQQIDEERDNPFLIFRKDELELITKIAFRFSDFPETWLKKIPGKEQDIRLQEALSVPDETVRRKAITLQPKEKSLEFLASTLENCKEDDLIRNLHSISWLGEKLSWSVLDRYRLDPSRQVRSIVWSLLYELNNTRATNLKNAEQKKFILAGGITNWVLGMILTISMIGGDHLSKLNWGHIITISLSSLGVSLLADKLSRKFSRIILAAILLALFLGVMGVWGLPVAFTVLVGISANLSIAAASIIGFIPYSLHVWNGTEQILWALPIILLVYAFLSLTVFSPQLLRRDRLVSWLLIGAGLAWSSLYIFELAKIFQPIFLIYICGIAFWQVFERASILENPHGTRFSYIRNLIQKTWSLLHQMPRIFQSGLGWIVGGMWAVLLMKLANIHLTNGDLLRVILISPVFILTTWYTNSGWLYSLFLIIAGSAIGFIMGDWVWASGICFLSCIHLGVTQANKLSL